MITTRINKRPPSTSTLELFASDPDWVASQPSMANYDRNFQWKMRQQQQQRHPSSLNNAYFAGGFNVPSVSPSVDRRTPCGNDTGSYDTDNRVGSFKRSRSSTRAAMETNSKSTSDLTLASYLQPSDSTAHHVSYGHPSHDAYATASGTAATTTTTTHPPTSRRTPNVANEWLPPRSTTAAPPTSTSFPSIDTSLSTPMARHSLALASPTTMFGMETLIAEYESGFDSLWTGPTISASVLGYDGDASHQTRAASRVDSDLYMPADELKMEYPQLPDLNDGDFDYIYGSMEPPPTAASSRGFEPAMARSSILMADGRIKRERPSPSPPPPPLRTTTGLLSPLPPSSFHSLTRSSVDTKRLSSAASASYATQDATPAASIMTTGMNTSTSSGGRRTSRPMKTTTCMAKQHPSATVSSSAKRPRNRQCDFPGCDNRARSHQKCKKHGGAHQCVFEGCEKNSQSRGLCIAHGGGSRCKVEGCTRASQSKGLCKSHGGGEFCAVEGCRKKAHLKHLCRTHGGGVRCKDPKCMKWAQRKGWCMAHAKEVLGA